MARVRAGLLWFGATILLWTTLCLGLVEAFKKDGLSNTLHRKSKQPYCTPSGPINDACCEYEMIENVNSRVSPLLAELVTTSFFRYWKTNLHKDCPFWQEDPLCILRDCSVIEAEESEIPEHWKTSALSSVDSSLSDDPFSLSKSCEYSEADFCSLEDELSINGCYINLIKNPERFTGYGGESAARIWGAIYKENCFNLFENTLEGTLDNKGKELVDTCMEKRVFYRLISGLHASISTHICDQWLDRKTGEWIRNVTCFADRVGNHPERVQNLYFTYTLMVRAIAKLAPFLQDHSVHHFCTGTGEDTDRIEDLVGRIATITSGCGPTFDEKTLFVDAGSSLLKDEFKNHFRNISQIMDCVGCEKCRLWGKLQVSGLGTALKILFSYGDDPELYRLTRGEVVALFNTFNRLSESVAAIDKFRELHEQQGLKTAPIGNESHEAPLKTEQLPPLPFADMFNYTRMSDPRHYFPYALGAVICIYGLVKIAHRMWQASTGKLVVPASADGRSIDEDGDKAEYIEEKEESVEGSATGRVQRTLERRVLGKEFHRID